MTTSDWILDIVLILVVLRQIRWSRIDLTTVLLPLGIVAFVAHKYLSPIPTGGNDLLVIGAFAALGTVLGIAGGLTTYMRVDQGKVFVRAGFIAASLWILSMGGRLAFVLWTEHGGGPTLMRFSEQHQITSVQTWVSALILMVLCEVGTRVGTIVIRAQLAKRTTSPAAPTVTTSTASPLVAARPIDRSRGSDSVASSREIFESLSR
jgi:hypothetical protein